MSGFYGRRMGAEERAEAEAELGAVAEDLGWVMRRHHGQSAMARVWVDPTGKLMCAVNLFTRSANVICDGNPAVEARGRVGEVGA